MFFPGISNMHALQDVKIIAHHALQDIIKIIVPEGARIASRDPISRCLMISRELEKSHDWLAEEPNRTTTKTIATVMQPRPHSNISPFCLVYDKWVRTHQTDIHVPATGR